MVPSLFAAHRVTGWTEGSVHQPAEARLGVSGPVADGLQASLPLLITVNSDAGAMG